MSDRFDSLGYPLYWKFAKGPAPAAEPVSRFRSGPAGGAYVGVAERRFCPRCSCNSAHPVPGFGRDVALSSRAYPDLDPPEVYWDCPACHTTWREAQADRRHCSPPRC